MSEKRVGGGVWTECGPKAEGLRPIRHWLVGQRKTLRSLAFCTAMVVVMFVVQPLITNHQTVVWAQTETATLSGVIQDPKGGAVPDTEVTVTRIETGTVSTTKTNGAGIYVLTSLIPGHYHMVIRKPGFKEIAIKEFELHVQDQLEQNFSLQIGSVSETVTVNGSGLNINTTDAAISTVIDHTFIENMPLNGNSLQTLFELTPGVVLNAGGSPATGGGFSVDGQRPTSNSLAVDGASGNIYSATFPYQNVLGTGIGTSASGGTNGLLPVDAVEEFRMQTSSYSAEYGRTPGGQIQVKTRGGTNEFHGSLFENFRNQVLDAQDWFNGYYNLKQAPLRMNDFGGTFGGPIRKNRLFFFVAHESLLMNQPQQPKTGDVPDQQTRQTAASGFQPYLKAYPQGNANNPQCVAMGLDPACDLANPGSDIYNYSVSNVIRDHTTSVRLDADLARGVQIFFRVNDAPSYELAPFVSYSNQTNLNLLTVTSGLSFTLSPRVLNKLTFNYSLNHGTFGSQGNPQTFLQAASSLIDPSKAVLYFGPATWFGMSAGPASGNDLHQYNVVDVLQWLKGNHDLKIGFDYRQISPRLFQPPSLQLYTFSPTSVQSGVVDLVFYNDFVNQPDIHDRNLSLYISDAWHFRTRLTINLGLRWEYNPPPGASYPGLLAMQGNVNDPASITLAPSGTALYKSRYDNFAPRVGAAYVIRDSIRFGTVIRAGGGVFFDTGQAAGATQATGFAYPYEQTASLTNAPYSAIKVDQLQLTAQGLPQSTLYLTDPNLRSPRTYQWSLSVEQGMGQKMALSTSYVGNHGDALLKENSYSGLSPTLANQLNVWINGERSSYNALQVQFRNQATTRAAILASYTYAHALDNGSSDFAGVAGYQKNYKADSDNDIRHVFSTAIHYNPQGFTKTRVAKAFTGGWSLDTVAQLQSASPLSVLSFAPTADYNRVNIFADLVPGVPTVVSDSTAPGGKRLNPAAFTQPPGTRDGTSARNGYRLFGLTQWDMAASRSWALWERTTMTFRVDAFNILNHPSFAGINTFWYPGVLRTFGEAGATYASNYGSTGAQTGSLNQVFSNGGARSLQLSLKLKF